MPKPVSKRASLPGAAELFRTTHTNPTLEGPRRPETVRSSPEPSDRDSAPPDPSLPSVPLATGRVRHDQKITVYFSSEELFALEDATLECKRAHGLRVDRGRLVRSAVALALADLAERGLDSDLVAALRAQ